MKNIPGYGNRKDIIGVAGKGYLAQTLIAVRDDGDRGVRGTGKEGSQEIAKKAV
jgi:hypothetical protein